MIVRIGMRDIERERMEGREMIGYREVLNGRKYGVGYRKIVSFRNFGGVGVWGDKGSFCFS